MKVNGFKVIGTAVIAAGLMTGAFLAGNLANSSQSGASAEEEPAPIVEQVKDEETDNEIVLVGDNEDDAKDEESKDEVNDEPAQPEVEDPAPPAVEPTPAPPVVEPQPPVVEPTPAPPVVEPTPEPVEPTPEPEPEPVNEAPFVVSINPENDENGVAIDSNIVITFSEPMDKASAQAALNLSVGNCGAFSWDGTSTEMTFDPCADFAYGIEVEVEVYTSAEDAEGLGMDNEFYSEFDVLQQSTIKIYGDGGRDGFVYGPGVAVFGDKAVTDGNTFKVGTWMRGFLSFDLDVLPEDLVEIQAAQINVKQSSHQAGAYTNATGNLLIDSLHYDTLTVGDFMAPSLNAGCWFCIVPTLSSDAANNWKSMSVLGWVRSDWEHRIERDYNSQYRLRFLNDCGDGSCGSVTATFMSGDAHIFRPYIAVTYTHP